MIKAIIFDLGGVILDIRLLVAHAQKIFRPKDKDKFWKEINIGIVPVSKGEITLLQFWRRLARKFGKKVSDKILKDLWIKDYKSTVSVNKEIEKIILSLRKDYRLAIISNTIAEHAKMCKKILDFGLFDAITLSYKIEMAKDGPEIFLLTAKRLGVKPEECIFIDDVQRFLEVAESVGMKTILFKNPEQLKSDLRKFGVKD